MSDPPAVIEVQSREELVALLGEAAELEHGLSCSYLFAAFSLKATTADGLSPEQVDAVQGWRVTISEVAEEEMLHLALVSNLLTALGAAPYLSRPPFPQTSKYYPAGITLELRRFSESTLTRFILLERPGHVDDDEAADDIDIDIDIDLDIDAPAHAPGALTTPDVAVTATTHYSTIAQLYEAIGEGLAALVTARGERNVFIGPAPAQATRDYFTFHDLVAVTDLASARQALEVLTTQGEGVQGDRDDSHYGKFLSIRDEFRALRNLQPDFDPAWPVVDNPAVDQIVERADVREITRSPAAEVMRMFNGCYTLMTAMLLRFFAHTEESDDALGVLAGGCVGLMTGALAPLGTLLATLPSGSEAGDDTAGASFELHRPITLLPHRRAAWMVFHERLRELSAYATEVDAGDANTVLTRVGAALDAIAEKMGTHIG